MANKVHVLYHAGCYDGFGAAYAAWKKFGNEADYIAVAHGAPPPEIPEGAEVYIVDFSYRRDVLLKLKEKTSKLLVLDHHVTAQKDLEGLDFAVFDMDRSGAGITWDYFHPEKERPLLINHIEDRDLWRFRIEGTKEIHALLVASKMTFNFYNYLATKLEDPEARTSFYDRGAAMLTFQALNVEKMLKFSYLTMFDGVEVPVVNVACSWSEVGEALLEKYPDAPFAVSYWDRGDGKRQFS